MNAGLTAEQLRCLDADQARAIFTRGEEADVFVLLELTRQLAEAQASDVLRRRHRP